MNRVRVIVNEEVLNEVINRFKLEPLNKKEELLNYYDTFDYRLYTNSLSLYKRGDKLYKRALNSSEESFIELKEVSPFLEDLKNIEFKRELETIIIPRALINLFDLRVTNFKLKSGSFNLKVQKYEVIKDAKSYFIANEIVTKYSKNAREALKELVKNKIDEDIIEIAIKKVDPHLNYTRKDIPELSIEEDASIAFKKIFQRLLLTIKANEDGTKEGIDIEFLHDFRVALRKSRAMLNYASGALNEEKIKKFKKELAYVAKLTNEARDLDVHIDDIKSYQKSLSKIVSDDIEPLIDILKEKRKKEQGKLIEHLNSQKYKEIMYEWEDFLNEEEIANRSILEISKEKLHSVYDKVIKKGKKITKDTKAEDMHHLRIEFKKFRYLLEFFTPLLQKENDKDEVINEMVKLSKVVQSALGTFQDLEVQQNSLKEYVKELVENDSQNLNTIMVLGKIFVDLKIKQNQIRSDFYSIFQKFYSKKEEFKELLI